MSSPAPGGEQPSREQLAAELERAERALRLAREELLASRDGLLEELGWEEAWGPVAVIGQLRHLLRQCSTQGLDPELAALVEAALASEGPYGRGLELEGATQMGTIQLGAIPEVESAEEDDPWT